MSSTQDTKGCDIYVSRFPCALCTKVMVQAGIRKCYYFPAAAWEMQMRWDADHIRDSISDTGSTRDSLSAPADNGTVFPPPDDMDADDFRPSSTTPNRPPSAAPCSPATSMYSISNSPDRNFTYGSGGNFQLANGTPPNHTSFMRYRFTMREEERKEKNKRSVQRLISNNAIALSMYIPQWDHSSNDLLHGPLASFELSNETAFWELDETIGRSPGMAGRWETIKAKFKRTLIAIYLLVQRYNVPVRSQTLIQDVGIVESQEGEWPPSLIAHAMVLAHIAARRTDDPKVGVGAVIVDLDKERYFSTGWNGYPKKAEHLDYPQAGADDSVEDEELKYDYILHAEQNALLWRNPPGMPLSPTTTFVTTKMPCDECSPIISDLGVTRIYTNRQAPKPLDDPGRLRGLTYDKCHRLIREIYVFDI
ncbi:Cytidine and dCMP deaminase domain-containing protein 1 [Quaeritorhiza haematococci]|nr:Cytidine and dCMP deaminase domain-containing protein 1 [Quaeritorhiza haematococci]